MGVSYLVISSVSTVLSLIGLQCWTEISLENFKSDGLIGGNTIYTGNMTRIIELLLRSHVTISLLAVCVVNVYVLLLLSLKTLFFGELVSSEIRKLAERLVNYLIYKGTFLPLIIPPSIFQAGIWLTWLTVLCSLKMFQALARDRLERLNASPSATPWTYFRVYSALISVFTVDIFWLCLCMTMYGTSNSSISWLSLFEPLSIGFETLQAIVIHGFQLLDIRIHHSSSDTDECQSSKFLDTSKSGSLWEWRSNLVRNLGFFLDMMALLMALGHYVLIWWLHGMAFHLIDAILFLNIRALLSTMVKRIKGFLKLRRALGTLHEALPDATSDEIQSYDDECAICRASVGTISCFHLHEPMAKAKRLTLDQGLSDMYSCPTCRKPLFVGRNVNEANPHTTTVSSDEQLARQLSAGLNQPGTGGQVGLIPNQSQNTLETSAWRGSGLDPNWLHRWSSQDGAGPSNGANPAGLSRVQMMMRHLASVGETYAQNALEDTSWSLWPTNPSQATTSDGAPFPPPATQGYPVRTGVVHRRALSRPVNDSIANLLAMAETVRDVLPHVPDDLIFQDLQRTNSVTVTVNNLLQM
ncbi:hypothetical protein V2J09_001841 [Rumex salicifolius]